jgi:hypothetical protein
MDQLFTAPAHKGFVPFFLVVDGSKVHSKTIYYAIFLNNTKFPLLFGKGAAIAGFLDDLEIAVNADGFKPGQEDLVIRLLIVSVVGGGWGGKGRSDLP